ncbi:Iron complex transport system permease protein [Hyphomicrobiales bacterium]|nr:Iron complex transport system permease protein [Hyphomicrobiales bacterium]CAH1693751.1 Iron complex transport system permease protein [Hyphomicrobiales bacterium]
MTTVVVVTAAFMIVGGLLVGARPLAPQALVSALFWPDGKTDSIIVWVLRLPRSLAAFLGGAGLSVSGYLLQTLTRNPLAGPGLTGVTSGAVAAIVFCFAFLPWLSSLFYPLIGMAGGLGAALVTFWIARGSAGRPLHLALGGISVSLLLGAVTTYILLLSGSQVQSILFWLSGGFQGRTWIQLAYMAPWVVLGLVGALMAHRVLALLALSEDAAAGMGLQLKLWKPLLLFLAVLPVAGVVPVAGPVAFVGLATPHIARLLKPDGQGWTVALAAALGGLMVTAADIVARSIATPRELPVSIVTALIGGPVFIYLVQARNFSLKSGGKR